MEIGSLDEARLVRFVLEFARLSDSQPQGSIVSPTGVAYPVLPRIGGTSRYNLYGCLLPSGATGMLKIAARRDDNGALDREAVILHHLRSRALEMEAANTGKPMNLEVFFPECVESFICPIQMDRRVTILGFPAAIEDLTQLGPVSDLFEKERVRVDPRTAAWILGKTLKLIAFAHDSRIANHFIAASNILIERQYHGVMVIDWTAGEISARTLHVATVRQELAQIARLAIQLMGGDQTTGCLPVSDQLPDDRFERFVWQLATGSFTNAALAHRRYYTLIYELWHGFWPFQSFPIAQPNNEGGASANA